jgi:hypothetical protein
MTRRNKKVQISMRGIAIDMDAMRSQNDQTIAIGNARMNARGDIMGQGGKIEIRREQIIRDFYAQHPQGMNQVSLKAALPDTFESPADAWKRIEGAVEETPTTSAAEENLDAPTGVAGKKARKLVDKSE